MSTKLPQEWLLVINQIFEMEQKVKKITEPNTLQRNIEKLKNHFNQGFLPTGEGITWHNPIGEKYTDTRTDCEASIAGQQANHLVIVEVIKPIVRIYSGNQSQIVQKAVVVVQAVNA